MCSSSKLKNKQPEVPIEIDEDSGVWMTDGLPMLYVPRHFFNNLHLAISEALSAKKYDKLLYQSGYKSAYYWCNQQAKELNLDSIECIHHYLKRLSQRGWGQMNFKEYDFDNGRATISVDYSSFVLHLKKFPEQINPKKAKNGVCYLFKGWFAGAADWVEHSLNPKQSEEKIKKYQCRETNCAINSIGEEKTHPTCFFELIRKNDS